MTGCQHLSVAPFSVKHFTRVHVCDKFPVLKKWREQYVWLEILSPKFHRYDVEIFQLYFHLCFIWSCGHRFLEQRFTIAKHSEMCIVYRTRACVSQKPNMPVPKMLHLVLTYTSSWSVVSLATLSDLGLHSLTIHASLSYRIAGNFWGTKLSWISRFYDYSQKFSLQNLGVWHLLAAAVSNPRKFSPQISFFLLIHTSFFPAEVSRIQ